MGKKAKLTEVTITVSADCKEFLCCEQFDFLEEVEDLGDSVEYYTQLTVSKTISVKNYDFEKVLKKTKKLEQKVNKRLSYLRSLINGHI